MRTTASLIILLILTHACAYATPPLDEGKVVFSARCAACHNVNKVLTGPALAGVDQRHSMEWIINFVRSSQTVIKSGDKEAVALYEKFNKIPMPDHPDLTPADIKNIVAYINSATEAAGKESAPFRKPGALRPAYQPLSAHDYPFFICYVLMVLLLAGGLLALVKVKEVQRQRSGEA